MKRRYDVILFDFDGTLVDTAPDIAYFANVILKRYGYAEQSIDAVKRAVGKGVHELIKGLSPEFPAAELERAVESFKELYRAAPAGRSQPFQGVTELLAGPLAGMKLAICTNKPQDITEHILKELGMEAHFDECLGLFNGFPPKPDPTGALHLMRQLGARKETTLFIGDSHIDSLTAQSIGVDFGYCSYGYDAPGPAKPRWIFQSPADWAIAVDQSSERA